MPSASLIATEIREKIYQQLHLRASAGISTNKFLAKIASDINKPNGQKTIPPEEVIPFLETLPIEKFYGIGKVTTAKMYQLGIFYGKDLKAKSLDFLTTHFKNSGEHYYHIVRGIHNSPVTSDRLQKSVGTEHTFVKNLTSEIFMLEKLKDISKSLEERLLKNNVSGKTITLKIKYSNFSTQTRSKTLPYFIKSDDLIFEIVKELLLQEKIENSVRLLGVSVSNLNIHQKKKPQRPLSVQLEFKF